MKTQDVESLKFRYLLWFYKVTKDAFDRVERKFTQLDIDKLVLSSIENDIDYSKVKDKEVLQKFLDDFKIYIKKKEKEAFNLTRDGEKLKEEYYFLQLKLVALEKAVISELGEEALMQIKKLYEEEMKKRILETKDHT